MGGDVTRILGTLERLTRVVVVGSWKVHQLSLIFFFLEGEHIQKVVEM